MNSLKDKLISKLKATSIHLLISLLIFFVILYVIIFHWYPEPFFTAQGGWHGIKLMAFVDLVLGPALTFIVFDHLKSRKTIVFDLTIVAAVQVIALSWGGYNVYTQRPIALVFWANSFYTVTSADFTDQQMGEPDLSQYSLNTPALIYSRPVMTQLENAASMELTSRRIPIYAQPMFYEPFSENLTEVFKHQIDINEVISQNTEMKTRLVEVVGFDFERYKYIALNAKYQKIILVFDDDGALRGEVKVSSKS